MDLSNVKKACTETLILRLLAEGPRHGYDLAKEVESRSEGYFQFKHGTLYPILHKLEKDGFIEGTWSDEGPRARRRHYRVTAKGREYALELREGWRDFAEHLLEVIGRTES